MYCSTKRMFFLLITAISLACTSCNFTEEIFIEENGNGKIAVKFDGSQLLQVMEESGAKTPKESQKAIDSIISFKEVFASKKDSIALLPKEEQEKLKRLEPFTMHMVMNAEEKLMKFDMFSTFENINTIGNVLNDFLNASSVSSTETVNGKAKSPVKSQSPSSEVKYNFSNNIFTRKVKITDQELFESSLKDLKQMESFLAGSTYTFKYHFPRKIKSTSATDATFSQDGKTLIYEVDYLSVVKDPESTSFEVELER